MLREKVVMSLSLKSGRTVRNSIPFLSGPVIKLFVYTGPER